MSIIEQFIQGKQSTETCEDAIAVTPHFVAVIDGSTSKTPFRLFPAMSNGRAASQLVKEFVEQEAKADCTVEEFCQGVTAHIRHAYDRLAVADDLALLPERRATASAVIYSIGRRELWLIGDCQALIDGRLYENGKPYEAVIAQQRASLIQHGTPPAEARKTIEPQLIKAMEEGQNKTYAVIDGFPIFMNGVRTISVGDSARELVLASDGYPFLRPTLEASEQALAHQLATDPQNIHTFVATKGLKTGFFSFDDRSYIRIALM